MTSILLVSFIYVAVYGVDTIRFELLKDRYKYVSRETYFLFLSGILALFAVFHMELTRFFSHNTYTELAFLLAIFSVSLFSSLVMYKTQAHVCYIITRSERCLVPFYVFVRALDLLFQQLAFLLLAIAVSRVTDISYLGYIVYGIILALTQIPVVLSSDTLWKYTFIIGIVVLSAPFYYTYTILGLLWPAAVLHTLMHVFIWIGLANPTDAD